MHTGQVLGVVDSDHPTNHKDVADFILGYPSEEVITIGQQQPDSDHQEGTDLIRANSELPGAGSDMRTIEEEFSKVLKHLKPDIVPLTPNCLQLGVQFEENYNVSEPGGSVECKIPDSMPVEVLELFLMKSYMKLFVREWKPCVHIAKVERMIYKTLSNVCSDWWHTLQGWPQSNTKHWIKHRLQRLIRYVCRPYRRHARLVKQFGNRVRGVTQLDDKIFVLSFGSDTIKVFGPSFKLLKRIKVKGLKRPEDIVACSETRSLYIADWSGACVWRVSTDGQVKKFVSKCRPRSLSARSGRLLVTTNNELLLYGADGVQLECLSFDDMVGLQHAVEPSRDTIVFCRTKPRPEVVKIKRDNPYGRYKRIVSFFNDQQLTCPCYLFESEDKMFITDREKHHILLLTSDLQLERVVLDREHNQLVYQPWRLLYVQQTRQLLVAGDESPGVVQVFAVD